jgi:hypothetical protein
MIDAETSFAQIAHFLARHYGFTDEELDSIINYDIKYRMGREAGEGEEEMPIIPRFYGIVIRMFYNDHIPPHFHAVYGEHEVLVSISPIAILQGQTPGRVRSMVLEWAALHQQELLENWNRCRRAESPAPVNPLE